MLTSFSNRSFKRKCQGRLRKHLADLCLQADRPGEAILHYQTSLDILKTVNDSLWIGGCIFVYFCLFFLLSIPASLILFLLIVSNINLLLLAFWFNVYLLMLIAYQLIFGDFQAMVIVYHHKVFCYSTSEFSLFLSKNEYIILEQIEQQLA